MADHLQSKRESRLTAWLVGFAFGALAGGFMLEAGVLALLLAVPMLLWSWREVHRPLGLAGFVAGNGSAWAFLLAWADERCAADASCLMPDQTEYLVIAAALVLAGGLVTILVLRAQASRSVTAPTA